MRLNRVNLSCVGDCAGFRENKVRVRASRAKW